MLNHLTKHKLPYNLVMIATAHEPVVNLCLLPFLRQLLVFPFLCCKWLNPPRLFPMAEPLSCSQPHSWVLTQVMHLLEHLRMLLPKAWGTNFFLHTWVLHTLKGQIKTPDAVNNSPQGETSADQSKGWRALCLLRTCPATQQLPWWLRIKMHLAVLPPKLMMF